MGQSACQRFTCSLGLPSISFQCSSCLPRVYMYGPTTTRPSWWLAVGEGKRHHSLEHRTHLTSATPPELSFSLLLLSKDVARPSLFKHELAAPKGILALLWNRRKWEKGAQVESQPFGVTPSAAHLPGETS